MVDIITVTGIWSVSLIFAFVSVRQPKGVDWYAPIGNKMKMIMTFINISIVLIVMVQIFLAIPKQLWKIGVVSLICLAIIFYLCFNKKIPKSKNTSTNYDNTLLDNICKLLTVFNSLFALLNICYMIYIYYMFAMEKGFDITDISFLSDVFRIESALSVHGTILLWSAISTSIVTAKSWGLENNNSIPIDPQKFCTAKYYAKRITDRNRS